MSKKYLYALWAVLFILCAGLGFIPEPGRALEIFMTGMSVLFFVPPAVLVYRAARTGETDTLKLVRNLSALSLGITLVTLILNLLGAVYSEMLGNILHFILIVVSTPMIASGYWVLSLFLWACLLMAATKQGKQK